MAQGYTYFFVVGFSILITLSAHTQERDQQHVKIHPPLDNGLAPEDIQAEDYLHYVQTALDTLIKHGTDRYGPERSDNLLVSVLDVRTKKATRGFAGDKWRVNRLKRRNPGARTSRTIRH
jgi:hypothetical protein